MLKQERNTHSMDAFELASSVRYLDDAKLKTQTVDSALINNFEAGLALNSLKISPEITPELYKSIIKEIIYEQSRNLKSLLEIYLNVGKKVFEKKQSN